MMINQVQGKLNNMIIKILCLKSLKQIYSAEIISTKLIVAIIYDFGSLQAVTKIICNEQLSNESIKLLKLKRHLDTLHSLNSDKLINFFADKKKEFIAALNKMKNVLFSSVK